MFTKNPSYFDSARAMVSPALGLKTLKASCSRLVKASPYARVSKHKKKASMIADRVVDRQYDCNVAMKGKIKALL